MIFKVKYTMEFDGKEISGIEGEGSWFLIDQRGNFYSHGPMQPVRPVEDCVKKIEPLILINSEYLTIVEIEKRIK